MLRYFTEREDGNNIEFTRSRPYLKNDNAHIAQKNWTHVRQAFGYHRFEDIKLVGLMNKLYSKELFLLHNYFCLSVKLIGKQRVKAKTIKVHDIPKTPYQRIIESSQISNEIKDALRQKQEQLDPFKLKKDIERKLKHIFTLVNVQKGNKRKAI